MIRILFILSIFLIFSCGESKTSAIGGNSNNSDRFSRDIEKYDNTVKEIPNEIQDEFLYVNGYRMARNMIKDSLNFRIDVFLQGFIDGLKDKDLKVPIDSMDAIVQKFSDFITKRQEEIGKQKLIEISVLQVKNLAEADSFLIENAKQPGVVSLPSKLQYKVIKDGNGAIPTTTDGVLVHMTSKFPDGTIFDDTRGGEPRAIPNERMIPGWLEAITKMKVGSKWIIYMHPTLAFGEFGMGDKVPPNKLTIVEVELLKIMTPEEIKEHLMKNPPKPMIPGGPVKGM